MKKTCGTLVAVLIVAALIAAGLAAGRVPLSPTQAGTLKTLAIVCGCSMAYCFAAGPLLLILLFMGSSELGEAISAGKYPAYADYQRQVRKYLPLRKFEARSEARQQA